MLKVKAPVLQELSKARWYVTPACTLNVSTAMLPAPESSSPATHVSAPQPPVYTWKRVSAPAVTVLMITAVSVFTEKRYHSAPVGSAQSPRQSGCGTSIPSMVPTG
jgi:hypothetical protein